jgi:FkbM family methyltransferase
MNIAGRIKSLILQLFPDRMLQGLKKYHYARTLRQTNEQTEPDMQIVRELVRPGDIVVDIGANFGLYTRFLSDLVGPQGRVYSVEPVPLTFEILTANIRALRLGNVEPLHLAMSDACGTVRMEVPRYPSGGENFYEARIVSENNSNKTLRGVEVESTTIDELFGQMFHPIDFIKCDVEGHELSCLRGATELLRRVKPAWLIEVSGNPDDPESKASMLFSLLSERGYEGYRFDGNHLIQRKPGDRSVNYFFLTQRHLKRLQTQKESLLVGSA